MFIQSPIYKIKKTFYYIYSWYIDAYFKESNDWNIIAYGINMRRSYCY